MMGLSGYNTIIGWGASAIMWSIYFSSKEQNKLDSNRYLYCLLEHTNSFSHSYFWEKIIFYRNHFSYSQLCTSLKGPVFSKKWALFTTQVPSEPWFKHLKIFSLDWWLTLTLLSLTFPISMTSFLWQLHQHTSILIVLEFCSTWMLYFWHTYYMLKTID